MYGLIDISNQMLEDSAFDHAGVSLRKAGLAVGAERLLMAFRKADLDEFNRPDPAMRFCREQAPIERLAVWTITQV